MLMGANADSQESQALLARLGMYQSASQALGERNWRLVHSYGRVMSGPYSGLYMSGIPMSAVEAFMDALLRGEEIPVHLMHRHVSGNYESSRLLFECKRLWMRFDDRTELA